MSDTAILVENLSKQYFLGVKKNSDGLRHVVHDIATAPLRWFKRGAAASNGDAAAVKQTKSLESFWALKDVSFEVKQGEVLGVIGRNGAGKSTLLKILSRITEPTRGRVEITGRVASLLEVGTGFHPELSGRENVFLNGAILGMSRAEIRKKFDEIVAFAGVEKFLDTPVKRYSSGMYVRLAFAVAAHLEPEILVVDEVLAVGDAEFQKKCLGKMKDVAGHGRTVLFVSHNMSAVRSLCKKAILLQDGRLLETGSADNMVDHYLANTLDKAGVMINLDTVSRVGDAGSRIKITRVIFNEGNDIRHGQPLQIDIHFKSYSSEEDVSFGVGFCNRDGTRLVSIDTDIPGERLKIAAGRTGMVSLKIHEFHMEPDLYLIDVGARSGDIYGLDYAPACGSVMVIPGDSTPSVIAMRESGRGGFRQPPEWKIQYDN